MNSKDFFGIEAELPEEGETFSTTQPHTHNVKPVSMEAIRASRDFTKTLANENEEMSYNFGYISYTGSYKEDEINQNKKKKNKRRNHNPTMLTQKSNGNSIEEQYFGQLLKEIITEESSELESDAVNPIEENFFGSFHTSTTPNVDHQPVQEMASVAKPRGTSESIEQDLSNSLNYSDPHQIPNNSPLRLDLTEQQRPENESNYPAENMVDSVDTDASKTSADFTAGYIDHLNAIASINPNQQSIHNHQDSWLGEFERSDEGLAEANNTTEASEMLFPSLQTPSNQDSDLGRKLEEHPGEKDTVEMRQQPKQFNYASPPRVNVDNKFGEETRPDQRKPKLPPLSFDEFDGNSRPGNSLVAPNTDLPTNAHFTAIDAILPPSGSLTHPVSAALQSKLDPNVVDEHIISGLVDNPEIALMEKKIMEPLEDPLVAHKKPKMIKDVVKQLEQAEEAERLGEIAARDADGSLVALDTIWDGIINPYNMTTDDWIKELCHSVLYEDEDLVVFNKPYGLACQVGGSQQGISFGKLVPLMGKRFKCDRLYLAHRLDQQTSGCIVATKSKTALDAFQTATRNKSILKRYWLMTRNIPTPPEGILKIPIAEARVGKNYRATLVPRLTEEQAELRQVFNEKRKRRSEPRAEEAITEYETLVVGSQCALMEASIRTGVKHQIRCHFGYGLNTPILGDHKYSHYLNETKPQRLPPQMLTRIGIRSSKSRHLPLYLHAREIVIDNWRGDGTPLFVKSELPKYFRKMMKTLRLVPK